MAKLTQFERDRCYKLLTIMQSHAPDNDAQQKCTTYYNTLQRELPTGKEVETQMAGALFDGLAYGNWLWAK